MRRRRSLVRSVYAPLDEEDDLAEERREQGLVDRLRGWRELDPSERYEITATLAGEYGYTSPGLARMANTNSDHVRVWARKGGCPFRRAEPSGLPVSLRMLDLVRINDRPSLPAAEMARMLGVSEERLAQARRVLRESPDRGI